MQLSLKVACFFLILFFSLNTPDSPADISNGWLSIRIACISDEKFSIETWQFLQVTMISSLSIKMFETHRATQVTLIEPEADG